MNSADPLCMEEILREIIALLALGDRKNAALVSKYWRQVCNSKKFTENEAFFIPNVYDYETVVNVLSGCQKEIINLRFDQSLVDEESLHLWRTCGDRIDSLAFSKCIFQHGIIPQIFQHCANLIEFSLQKGQFLRADNNTFHQNLEDALFFSTNNLLSVVSIFSLAPNVEHKKLTTFNLDSDVLHLQSSDLHRLASAFPGLRRLQMKMLVKDDFRPSRITGSSPNLSILFELLATSQLDVSILDVEFSTTLSRGCVTLNFDMCRKPSTNFRSTSDQVEETAVSQLEPYFTFDESLTPIPFTKFCTSFTIDTMALLHPRDVLEELQFVKVIFNNPQLEKFSMCIASLVVPEATGLLLGALIRSSLKYICLKVKAFILGASPFFDQVASYVERLNTPINMTVRRLKIKTNSYKFNAICVKHFGNVQHLTVKPVVADDVFKCQKNLKKFSIGVMDIPFSPPLAVVSVENLEVLKVRGSILGFLAAYQFPNLKYLIFRFYSKECDNNYDLETPNKPIEEDLGTLLPLFGLDSSERSGQESQSTRSTSRRRRRKSEVVYADKLFVLKLDRISSILAAKAPNLEGISVSGMYSLKTEDYGLFFKLCMNFPKLRYASVRSGDNKVNEEDIKAEILKYMSQCPSLRAFWFESYNCRTALYFDIISRKLEFSDHYSKRNIDADFGGMNLKKFYSHNR